MDEAQLKNWFQAIGPRDVLDWLLVGLLFYWLFQLLRRTRTVWLVRGFLILVGAYFLSSLAQLTLLSLIFDKVLIGVAVAIPVLFQPELRQLLEQLGRGEFLTNLLPTTPTFDPDSETIAQLLVAVEELSAQRIGALILLEQTPLEEEVFSDPGTLLEAHLSAELLLTIFSPKTPLHDGAVLIREGRVWAAAVILPITDQITSRQLGTRHRAALGISERSDSHCIVVSEETGAISFAQAGRLQRPLTLDQLKALLVQSPSGTTTQDWVTKFLLSGKTLRS